MMIDRMWPCGAVPMEPCPRRRVPMPDLNIASALAQFGAAGLIGWMWLTERRAASTRERHVAELHERLMQERPHTGLLLEVVRDNTRALTALELGQRTLTGLLERLAAHK